MARPDPKFDLENLLETGTITAEQGDVVRTATERIKARVLDHRRAWMGHAFDIRMVQETITPGHFEGWVRTQPFGRTKAFDYAKAAKLLIAYEADGGPKFGLLPPLNSTIICELAADGVDPAIRKRFLDSLVAGDTVRLAEVREALGKGKTEPTPEPQTEPSLEEEPSKREPTPAMERFAKTMMAGDRRFILDIARRGDLQLLIDALEWADASRVGIGRHLLEDDAADRIDERVADALRDMPKVALPGIGEAGNDDDSGEFVVPKKKIVH